MSKKAVDIWRDLFLKDVEVRYYYDYDSLQCVNAREKKKWKQGRGYCYDEESGCLCSRYPPSAHTENIRIWLDKERFNKITNKINKIKCNYKLKYLEKIRKNYKKFRKNQNEKYREIAKRRLGQNYLI